MQPWSRRILAVHSAVMAYLQALTCRALAMVALAALVSHGVAAGATSVRRSRAALTAARARLKCGVMPWRSWLTDFRYVAVSRLCVEITPGVWDYPNHRQVY